MHNYVLIIQGIHPLIMHVRPGNYNHSKIEKLRLGILYMAT